MKKFFCFWIGCLAVTQGAFGQQCGKIFLQNSTVITPNGSSVPVIIYQELCPQQITAANAEVAVAYPNATRLDDASSTYNCYAYAFHISEGGNRVWMNNPSTYWSETDGSYTEVTTVDPFPGKIVYSGGDHAAVTTSTSGIYISKWGDYPLMRHDKFDSPYDDSNLKYYVRCICSSAPDLQLMTYGTAGGGQGTAYTVNFVSANTWYNIRTNIAPCYLSNSISWSPNSTVGVPLNWYNNGLKNTEAYINLSSGQSVTFAINAQSSCGTSNRNPTWTAQSGYRMSSSTADGTMKDYLDIEFDNAEYLEILPHLIVIYDQSGARAEKNIDVKQLFMAKQFTDGKKKMRIDINKLNNGVKIVSFFYPRVDGKNSEQILSTDYEKKSVRIIVNN
jgi:hypothetical protein